MRHTADIVRRHVAFYNAFLRERTFYLGMAAALAAYMARAFAGGMFIPYVISDVSNGLYYRRLGLLYAGLWLLFASAVIYSATEWLFRPFWSSIARSIVEIKQKLIGGLRRSADNGDIIGRVVNDVDFVMWNVGGAINTFVPNILTAAVSEATILQMSQPLGLLALTGLPLFMVLLEYYVREVEKARYIERGAYSESIYAAGEYLNGQGSAERFKTALRSWLRGIGWNIFLDRVYWSGGLALNYVMPLAVALLGVRYAKGERSRSAPCWERSTLRSTCTAHW
nr:MAG: hypothetical protein TU35_04290 [Thermoproteus sp. AZ2]